MAMPQRHRLEGEPVGRLGLKAEGRGGVIGRRLGRRREARLGSVHPNYRTQKEQIGNRFFRLTDSLRKISGLIAETRGTFDCRRIIGARHRFSNCRLDGAVPPRRAAGAATFSFSTQRRKDATRLRPVRACALPLRVRKGAMLTNRGRMQKSYGLGGGTTSLRRCVEKSIGLRPLKTAPDAPALARSGFAAFAEVTRNA